MAFDLIGKAVKSLRLSTVNYSNASVPVIPAQAGDVNSRYFNIVLFDDRGDIPLREYSSATLNATLPDGSLQISYGEIDETKNAAVLKISGSMLTQVGKVTCDVQVTGVDDNGDAMCLTSKTFYILVHKSQADDSAIEGDDNYTLLQQLLIDVGELEDTISAAETQRQSNEESRQTNETTRINQEQERATAESARASAEQTRAANETNRQTAEQGRVTAETQRQSNEESRQSAEEARASEYAEISDDIKNSIAIVQSSALVFYYDEDGYVCYRDLIEE